MGKNISAHEAWTGEANCRYCALRQSVLFAGLTEEDFSHIHEPIDQFKLKSGTVLYHENEPGAHMFTIRSGLMKLLQYLPDGTQRIVRLARGTDVIGLETSLGQPYQHEAVTLQETEVCRYPAQVVRTLGHHNPALHDELLRRWQHALREADAWLTELSTGSAKQRIARLLIRMANGDPDYHCALFSREDLGAMLGITTETASRTVAEFKRNQLLLEQAFNQYRLNLSGLQEIANR